MRNLIAVLVVFTCLTVAHGQERLSREQCLKVTAQLGVDVKKLLDTPIPTDPDLKWPAAVAHGDRAALVLPECKLSVNGLTKVGAEAVPLGQLWLHKVTLLRGDQPLKDSELRLVEIGADAQLRTVTLHALAVGKDAQGKLGLLVYGKDPMPLLKLPLKEKAAPAQRDEPIDISATGQGNTGTIVLDILGKYEAEITAVVQDIN